MKKLSPMSITGSATIGINDLALKKIHAGERIFKLNVGEPMVPVSPLVERAVAAALRAGKTHYPPASGIPELREEASRWMNATYATNYSAGESLVVNGGKFGIFILLQALLKPGDEVLVQAPYWVSYPSMIRIFKGIPKVIHSTSHSNWKMSAKDILKHATKKTKILILNSGNNPTGSIYSRHELEAIMAASVAKGIFVISDEVYSGLTYEHEYTSAGSFRKYEKHVAIIQSCSKNFGMTGFRIGFLFLKNTQIMETLESLMSQSTTGVTTLAQWAALVALKHAPTLTHEVRSSMKKRRDIFITTFNKAFNTKLIPPASALYVFAPLSVMGWRGTNSVEFCRRAIEEANVAIVPGSAFGQEGYVRFSFGEHPQVLTQGILALARWVQKETKAR